MRILLLLNIIFSITTFCKSQDVIVFSKDTLVNYTLPTFGENYEITGYKLHQEREKRWGLANNYGKMLFPAKCTRIEKFNPDDNWAYVIYPLDSIKNEGAYINKEGKIQLTIPDSLSHELYNRNYDSSKDSTAHFFVNEMALVCSKKTGLRGLINRQGKLVIPCIYNDIGYFSENLAYAAIFSKPIYDKDSEIKGFSPEKIGYIDQKNQWKILLPDSFLNIASDYSHGCYFKGHEMIDGKAYMALEFKHFPPGDAEVCKCLYSNITIQKNGKIEAEYNTDWKPWQSLPGTETTINPVGSLVQYTVDISAYPQLCRTLFDSLPTNYNLQAFNPEEFTCFERYYTISPEKSQKAKTLNNFFSVQFTENWYIENIEMMLFRKNILYWSPTNYKNEQAYLVNNSIASPINESVENSPIVFDSISYKISKNDINYIIGNDMLSEFPNPQKKHKKMLFDSFWNNLGFTLINYCADGYFQLIDMKTNEKVEEIDVNENFFEKHKINTIKFIERWDIYAGRILKFVNEIILMTGTKGKEKPVFKTVY